jgi:hypothetical protein
VGHGQKELSRNQQSVVLRRVASRLGEQQLLQYFIGVTAKLQGSFYKLITAGSIAQL